MLFVTRQLPRPIPPSGTIREYAKNPFFRTTEILLLCCIRGRGDIARADNIFSRDVDGNFAKKIILTVLYEKKDIVRAF